MISFFFFFIFKVFLLPVVDVSLMKWGGVWQRFEVSVTVTPPPHPTPLLTSRTQPNHHLHSRRTRPRKLRFTFVAVHLGSLVGNGLHLGRGVLYLRLAFGVIVLHSLTALRGNRSDRTRERQKREEYLLTITKSFSHRESVCSELPFVSFFKERRKEKLGGKHARCFEGICFPSWNWMHFTHNGIKLTILARHQIRVHGCHSYFRGTMSADVEWDRAVTVGTMHEGMKEWGITYNTNYNTQEDYTLSGPSHHTMGADSKANIFSS